MIQIPSSFDQNERPLLVLYLFVFIWDEFRPCHWPWKSFFMTLWCLNNSCFDSYLTDLGINCRFDIHMSLFGSFKGFGPFIVSSFSRSFCLSVSSYKHKIESVKGLTRESTTVYVPYISIMKLRSDPLTDYLGVVVICIFCCCCCCLLLFFRSLV